MDFGVGGGKKPPHPEHSLLFPDFLAHRTQEAGYGKLRSLLVKAQTSTWLKSPSSSNAQNGKRNEENEEDRGDDSGGNDAAGDIW